VFLGLSALEAANQVSAVPWKDLGLPAHADWVDRVVGADGSVSLVGGRRGDGAALLETAFWNGSIARVYYTCSARFGPDFGEQQLTAGAAIRTLYAVAPASFRAPGRVLARDRPGKLVLIAPPRGTLRVPSVRCGR